MTAMELRDLAYDWAGRQPNCAYHRTILVTVNPGDYAELPLAIRRPGSSQDTIYDIVTDRTFKFIVAVGHGKPTFHLEPQRHGE